MRRPALLLAFAAAACSPEQGPGAAVAGEPVACALGPAGGWNASCRLERTEVDDRDLLIVHHPDGAFHRFVVIEGGRGVAAADGAAQVSQHRQGRLLEVSLGADRYRLPLAPGAVP